MRRLRYKSVQIAVHPSFYERVNDARKKVADNLGLQEISYPKFTEMLAKSGFQFPTVGRDLNDKIRKKR